MVATGCRGSMMQHTNRVQVERRGSAAAGPQQAAALMPAGATAHTVVKQTLAA